jgi:membrane-associated phospholipid phosphatase
MKKSIVVAALLLAGAARAEAPAGESRVESTADMLLIGVPVVALGLTFLLPDGASAAKPAGFDLLHMTGAPRHDLGLAMLRATTVTYGLKYAVDEERPNGEDGGFPSGHTAITFAGAEFIRKEYGLAWAAPAYLAASYVGWSRVETRDHWWHDVLAGAAIGVLSNHDLGTLSRRWGALSVKPAMLKSYDAAPAGFEPRAAAAPGIKLELRF